MKTVKEVSRLTGVSVRTLHHYDAIGLLRPAHVTEAGYRLYDRQALERLHSILLLRQLRFPLKEIREILDRPNFDPREALADQLELLKLQRSQLDELIAHTEAIMRTGVISMNFEAFDNGKQERYAREAKAKWGKTDAYKEYEEKTKGVSPERIQDAGLALMAIFAEFGEILHLSPESGEAQALVKKLQDHITAHFYTCTPQILSGLGQMYVAGGEMTENIDKAGGAGTAEFAAKAIAYYCK